MTKQEEQLKTLRKLHLETQRIARLKTRLEEYKVALRTRKLKGNEHYYACTWDDVEFLLAVINKDRYA